MNKPLNNLLLSLLLALALVHGASGVHAQEATSSTDQATTSAVVSVPQRDTEIATARQEYRQALEKYRQLERQYSVDIEQYRSLQTLSALEVAVRSTRETTIARNDVLATYLTLVQLLLQEQKGIEVTLKEQYLSELSTRLDELSSYRNLVQVAEDRPSLAEARTQFEVFGPKVEATAYQVQTLLVSGKLQAIYDQAVVITDELAAQVDQQSDLVTKPERQRAIAETRESLDRVKTEMSAVNSKITLNNDQEFTRSNYTNFTRQLTTVYSGLTQSLNFLSELTAGK